MGSLKVADSLSKCIISATAMAPQSLRICRGFVSATRPSQKNETMIDKETCEKVIEAANAITASAKEVRHLVRDVKEVVAIGAESVRTLLLSLSLSIKSIYIYIYIDIDP
nr:neurofilament medium polypeptide isoform X2 [Ipomoea batatas]